MYSCLTLPFSSSKSPLPFPEETQEGGTAVDPSEEEHAQTMSHKTQLVQETLGSACLLASADTGQRVITPAEHKIYLQDFTYADTNGNGAIDPEEIPPFYYMLCAQAGRVVKDAELDRFKLECDKNADGMISFQEYMDWVLGEGWSVADGTADSTPQ